MYANESFGLFSLESRYHKFLLNHFRGIAHVDSADEIFEKGGFNNKQD